MCTTAHQENKTQIKGHENSPQLCSDTEFMGVENTAATIAPFFTQSLKKVQVKTLHLDENSKVKNGIPIPFFAITEK